MKDGERHRKTARNENSGIEGAPPDIQYVATGGEGIEIHVAVYRVGEEHAAEKHDLGQQEPPHTERACLALLLHAFEMVHEPRMVVRMPVRMRYRRLCFDQCHD